MEADGEKLVHATAKAVPFMGLFRDFREYTPPARSISRSDAARSRVSMRLQPLGNVVIACRSGELSMCSPQRVLGRRS
jgi:hypothetical protein